MLLGKRSQVGMTIYWFPRDIEVSCHNACEAFLFQLATFCLEEPVDLELSVVSGSSGLTCLGIFVRRLLPRQSRASRERSRNYV